MHTLFSVSRELLTFFHVLWVIPNFYGLTMESHFSTFVRFQLLSRIEIYYRDVLSFFLSEIYLLLWEPSFVGTRVSAIGFFHRSIPRSGLTDYRISFFMV